MLNNNPENAPRGFINPDDADARPDPATNTPSRILLDDDAADGAPCAKPHCEQVPVDLIDEESMESFPCSDPPSYSTCHS